MNHHKKKYSSSLTSGKHRGIYGQNLKVMSAMPQQKLVIKQGLLNVKLPIEDIMYLQADHIYVRVFLRNEQCVLIRKSLTWLIEQLPDDVFVQVHRSFAVNFKFVTKWNRSCVYVQTREIPVSRGRQKMVDRLLS